MNRQNQIKNCFKSDFDKVLSKKQIKEISGISYYCNTDKHLGQILTRMVRNKTLLRIKKGFYMLNKKSPVNNPDQLKLI